MHKHPVEILKDIVEYYKINPRGVDTDNAGCIYAGCAVGFACGFQVDGWDSYESSAAIDEIYLEQYDDDKKMFWSNFLPEYRYEDISFWSRVQRLHDNPYHWKDNEQGGTDLTDQGLRYYEYLVDDYSDPHGPGQAGWDAGDEHND